MASTYTKPEVWWIERDSIAIATQSDSSTVADQFSGPADGKEVTLFVTTRCDHFTTTLTEDLSTTGLPDEFHDAIIAKAIQRGYEMKDPQLAQYWGMKFDQQRIEAKKYANIGRDGSTATSVKGYDY